MTDLDDPVPGFAVALRGYDRGQVDAYVARLEQQLEEAEERIRLAEAARDPNLHSDIGPRISTIFELARAEAVEMRDSATSEATARLNSAKREATAILEAARQRAAALTERKAREWETKLDGFEAEREQIRADIEALSERRDAVLAELRRLHDALGSAPGLLDPATPADRAAASALAEPADEAEPAGEAATLVQRMEQAEAEADPEFVPEAAVEPEDSFEFADATVEMPTPEPGTEELGHPR